MGLKLVYTCLVLGSLWMQSHSLHAQILVWTVNPPKDSADSRFEIPDFNRLRTIKAQDHHRALLEFAQKYRADVYDAPLPEDLVPALMVIAQEGDADRSTAALELLSHAHLLPDEFATLVLKIFCFEDYSLKTIAAARSLERFDPRAVEKSFFDLLRANTAIFEERSQDFQQTLRRLLRSSEARRELMSILKNNELPGLFEIILKEVNSWQDVEVQQFLLVMLQSEHFEKFLTWTSLQTLSQSKDPFFRLELSLRLNELGALAASKPELCARIFNESNLWDLTPYDSAVTSWFFDPIAERVLDSSLSFQTRLHIFESCFKDKALVGYFSDEWRARIISDFWPELWVEQHLRFPTEPTVGADVSALYYYNYNSRLRTHPKSMAALNFYLLDLIPALNEEQSRELAEEYLREVACLRSSRIQLSASTWQKAWQSGGRAKLLAQRLNVDRIAEPSLSEIHRLLVADPAFDELSSEALIPSRFILGYLQERWQSEDFKPRALYLNAIQERWKGRAANLVPLILSSPFTSSVYERELQSGAVAAVVEDLGSLQSFSREIWPEILLKIKSPRAVSESFARELSAELPGERANEEIVGAVLWFFGANLEKIPKELHFEIKAKILQALEIHVGPKVDGGFLLLLSSLMRAHPEWTAELQPKHQEVREAMQ